MRARGRHRSCGTLKTVGVLLTNTPTSHGNGPVFQLLMTLPDAVPACTNERLGKVSVGAELNQWSQTP